MRSIVLVSTIVSALCASTAEAQCTSRTETGCFCRQPSALGIATAEAISETTTTLHLESITPDGGSREPQPFDVPTQPWDKTTTRSFVLFQNGSFLSRLQIDDTDHVLCTDAHGSFPVTLDDAKWLAFDESGTPCTDMLHARGFRESKCNDNGGCATASGVELSTFGLALCAALLALGRRRRAR